GRQLLAKTDIVPEMVIVSAPGSAYRTAGRQRLDQAVPYFFPGTTMAGILHYGNNTEVYADTLDECRYLICIKPLVSHVDEGFYTGGIDRELVTTVVFIIDAEQREVVHIKVIGTDVPGATVDFGANKGKPKYEEAEQYILDFLDGME
ncbi:MAG: hypothetical protein IJM62_08430, partial [Lachnospiraceae bacterium]|nr:hypothetical protein [Lachnospiraceae bacterium]